MARREVDRLKPVGAVVAAYALLLQLFFAGIVSAQMAADAVFPLGATPICTSDGASGEHERPHSPVAHQFCIVCALASAVPLLPTRVLAPPLETTATPAAHGSQTTRVVLVRAQTPHQPRGPPQSA